MVRGQTSQASTRTALVWFRQDLRLSDHRPLTAALEGAERILAVYVHDMQAAARWAPGGAALWWLHHSLASLGRAIERAGGMLVLRRGDASSIIPDLARRTGAHAVHCGLAHEPWLRMLDGKVAEQLAQAGIAFHAHRVATLFDLGRIRTGTGGIYGVYTPFARACRALPDPEPPLPQPAHLPMPPGLRAEDLGGERLQDWRLLPTRPDWAGGLRGAWQPGEQGADARVRAFLADHLDGYGVSRDLPGDEDGTSRLSPHLHWGEISPVQVWHAARAAQENRETGRKPGGQEGQARSGFETFQGELLWHEFAAYLLRNHPEMPEQPLRAAFRKLRWRRNEAELRAWQQGRTGIPIVDAGMRQLWHTGWMHNRVRMIAASFLVKHLLLSWQDGEAWFWDTLVDADLATNSASWQWIAGCGTDAQPFFRIFNPLTQSRKFDPRGNYIRRWVPELAALPDRFLHAPWEASDIPAGYPRPVVALDAGRDRALAAFRAEVRVSA